MAGVALAAEPGAVEPSARGGLPAEGVSPRAVASIPLELITQDELAALPQDSLVAWSRSAEAVDGPVIEIDSPENLGTYEGPFPIRVHFRIGPKGFAVDMASLKLTYKKAWGIDITERVRAYIAGTAIDVEESELPRGRHTVEIEISDVQGNESRRFFTVTVK